MTPREIKIYLAERGIENAAQEARILFSHFTKISESALLADNPSSDSEELRFAVRLRGERYPLQYILGYACFYRERYRVGEEVLIPREDTELLVDYAVKQLPHGARFADFCTGSGCVAISVLASRPDLTALAVDISEGALLLARDNARDNGVSERVIFARHDVLCDEIELDGIDWILSNPPYVSKEEMKEVAPELLHEPRLALCPLGDDATVFYKHMLDTYPNKSFIFEIGCTQGAEVGSYARARGRRVQIIKDYSGNDRVLIIG